MMCRTLTQVLWPPLIYILINLLVSSVFAFCQRLPLTTFHPGASLNYLTFQVIMEQLNTIVADLTPFINRINRIALWFAKTKLSLEMLVSNPGARPTLTQDSAECWRGISDQFSLLIYKVERIR